MSPIEDIQERLRQLPLEKQVEVLDFISFLQQQMTLAKQPVNHRSIREHPAFGSWRERDVDSLNYQSALRAEWDARS